MATRVAVEQQAVVQHVASTVQEQQCRGTIAVEHGAKRKSRSNPSHFDPARVRRAQIHFNGCQPEIMPLSLAGILYRPLGLSLSLGTSRHPRPFDKTFVIQESSLESSPYPCFVSRRLLDSHGLARLDCQTAVHPCRLSGYQASVTSVNTVTRFISSCACRFDRDSTSTVMRYTLSIRLAFAQSL